MVRVQVELAALAALQTLMVGLLTASEVAILAPAAVTRVIRINTIGSTANFTRGALEQEFSVLALVQFRLSSEALGVVQDALRDVATTTCRTPLLLAVIVKLLSSHG